MDTLPLFGAIAGSTVGFLTFVVLLESKGMGSILYRNGSYRPSGLIKYLKSPFESDVLWNPNLLPHNWIVMTASGALVGAFVDSFVF